MAQADGYRFSPAAREDLEEIWSFSFERWGQAPADSYVLAMQKRLESLLANPMLGRRPQGLIAGLRILDFRSHVIVYRRVDSVIEVVRIMHARQNWHVLFDA